MKILISILALNVMACSQVVDFDQTTGTDSGPTLTSVSSGDVGGFGGSAVTQSVTSTSTSGSGGFDVTGTGAGGSTGSSDVFCDTECLPDQVCLNGECVCLDENCPGGFVCQDGSCVQVDPCDGVVCPEGECVGGKCHSSCEDPCSGVECPEGKVCSNGACVCDGDGAAPSCGDKTQVCHFPPGNEDHKHNICVADQAVPAHLAHGDKLGDCSHCD
jgi:hypothetical protein